MGQAFFVKTLLVLLIDYIQEKAEVESRSESPIHCKLPTIDRRKNTIFHLVLGVVCISLSDHYKFGRFCRLPGQALKNPDRSDH